MSDFANSPEAQAYATRVEQLDEYFDLMVRAFKYCGVGDELVPFYEVEDRIAQGLGIQDPQSLELIMSSVLIEHEDHTSLVQLEEMRMRTHSEILNECMRAYFTRVLTAMAS